MRVAGRWLTWNQKPAKLEGILQSSRKGGTDDKSMIVSLHLSGSGPGGPTLYDPRVVSISGNEMCIVGLEKHEYAWVLQEWRCEVLSIRE